MVEELMKKSSGSESLAPCSPALRSEAHCLEERNKSNKHILCHSEA